MWVDNDSICGSLTAPALKIGVSTSNTPRASKNARAVLSMIARCRKAGSVAVGRQLTEDIRGLAQLDRRAGPQILEPAGAVFLK